MDRRRAALLLLACALIASTALRVAAGAEKQGLSHDSSISMLAAACHQGDYMRLTAEGRPPFGRWVAASELKALLRPDRPLCLAQISRDLAREDIHPPLYFWLLHGWTLAFGPGLWTGVSLNVVLGVLTGLALFGLARRVLGDPLRGAAVAAVWSFSPAAIRVFAEARQYELMALLAVLFVWQCLRFCDPPTRSPRRDAVGLAALSAAGALAQFLFALVAAAGAAVLAMRLAAARQRLLAWGLASIAMGYAVFSLVHPGFVLSLRRGGAQATDAAVDLVTGRLEMTTSTFAQFLLPPTLARGGGAWAACGVLAATTAIVLVAGSLPRRERAMALVFAWLGGTNAALFLLFVSPASAMDFKHLSVVWPFAAFVPVLAVGLLPGRLRVAVGTAAGAALATSGTVAVMAHHREPVRDPPLERADAVLVDNVARGVLPRVVWRLDDRMRVFASDQRRLLADPAPWLEGLERGDVFVGGLPESDPRYGNTPDRGRRVAAAIAARHRLRRLPDPLEPGHVFDLQDPLRAAAVSRRADPEAARM